MNANIYLDKNVSIEAFKYVDPGSSPVWRVLEAVEHGEFYAIPSEITYSELLPKLIVDGETQLIGLYERLFDEQSMFRALPISRDVLDGAAHVRARRVSLRLPDAIHVATAALNACVAIVSNDLRLGSTDDIPVVPISADSIARLRDLIR